MVGVNLAPDHNGHFRIALTGGPGGGKTTAADLFRREIGEAVVVVPEAATILFTGGFPRTSNELSRRATQRAIFHTQRNLEEAYAALYPKRVLLCDRGTVDGAAYWPDDVQGFFDEVGTSLEVEFRRYDAVIFFESAAVGGLGIEGGNPARIESLKEAARLDSRLRELWSQHPRFILVPNTNSFFKKLTFGLASLESIVSQLETQLRDSQPS